MGLFRNLLHIRTARKEISRNPLYQIVLTHTQKEIHESPHELIQKLPEESREKIIQEICDVVEAIWKPQIEF